MIQEIETFIKESIDDSYQARLNRLGKKNERIDNIK